MANLSEVRHLVTLAMLSSCGACVSYDVGLDDLPTAALRPEVGEGFTASAAELWPAIVGDAADAWNGALLAAGCGAPFHLAVADEPAYPVTLWTRTAWPHGAGDVGHLSSGRVGAGRVDVCARAPLSRTLPIAVHELGHALGLAHAEPGEDSAMTPTVGDLVAPSPGDVEWACAELRSRGL